MSDNDTLPQRVLALAGLVQALHQVRRIAETGQAEDAAVRTAVDSVFRIEAASPQAVYGSAAELSQGLRLLRDHLRKTRRDDAVARLAMAIFQLERRFDATPDAVRKVVAGLNEQSASAESLGASHPDVLAALGNLYSDTLSHLRPRIMVQGNPHYLGQPGVVAEIRALLLAAVRSAALWRQLGGSLWDFLFSRRALLQATEDWLR